MKRTKHEHWKTRSDRVRKQIGGGTAERPRMVVYCSNTSISVQIIDDTKGVTLACAHSIKEKNGANIKSATKVGTDIAQKATGAKVKQVVFDRNGYAFHGRVRALADAARAAGLEF